MAHNNNVYIKECGVGAYLNAPASVTITTAGDWYPVPGTFTNVQAEGFEGVATPGIKKTCSGIQQYEIDWHCSVEGDRTNTNTQFTVKIYDASTTTWTTYTDWVMKARLFATSAPYPCSGTLFVELDKDDIVQLVCTSDGNGDVLTFDTFNTTIREKRTTRR